VYEVMSVRWLGRLIKLPHCANERHTTAADSRTEWLRWWRSRVHSLSIKARCNGWFNLSPAFFVPARRDTFVRGKEKASLQPYALTPQGLQRRSYYVKYNIMLKLT
jgi:hypothetical protein